MLVPPRVPFQFKVLALLQQLKKVALEAVRVTQGRDGAQGFNGDIESADMLANWSMFFGSRIKEREFEMSHFHQAPWNHICKHIFIVFIISYYVLLVLLCTQY